MVDFLPGYEPSQRSSRCTISREHLRHRLHQEKANTILRSIYSPSCGQARSGGMVGTRLFARALRETGPIPNGQGPQAKRGTSNPGNICYNEEQKDDDLEANESKSTTSLRNVLEMAIPGEYEEFEPHFDRKRPRLDEDSDSDEPELQPSRKSRRLAGIRLNYTKDWPSWSGTRLPASGIPDFIASSLAASYLSQSVELQPEKAWQNSKWRSAMVLHINNLKKLNVFQVAQLPQGKKAISARWVFAKKHLERPEKDQEFKARYVGKGFQQLYGRDYSTWSPTVRLMSIHFMLAMAAVFGVELLAFDIKDAYLRANLAEIIYLQPPKHFAEEGEVWRLIKAVPGLKQSGRAWYLHFSKILKKLGFEPTHIDPCVFTKKAMNKR